MKAKWFSTILILAMLFSSFIPSASAAPVAQGDGPIFAGVGDDNLEFPLGKRQAELKNKAKEAELAGKTNGNVYEAARGEYVELGKESVNDRVFVVLAEFGTKVHPGYGGTPGPMHNEIAEPDRTMDNTSIWQADYDKAHFEDIYFTQMVDYFDKQSSGQYTINGDVVDWVKVPFNEARYGSDACGSHVCSTVWYLIRDAINQWVADRKADGMTNTEIHDYLATFDVTDRYDADGDGIFSEPDGYIDHFQIVHAGTGQETGGGAQGDDAIWSHRWFTAYQGYGLWGPSGAEFGGMEFGGQGQFGNTGGPNATGVWVGDYTMQPEDGGLGVFAHEYTHDLTLPDQYDTSGGENSTGFWTLMSSGSYLGDGTVDLGSRPGDLAAIEKYWLGWLDYENAGLSETGSEDFTLGPAEVQTANPQALIVRLPYKEVVVHLAEPFAGSHFYYSGSGDDLRNDMSRSVTLPAGAASFSAWTYFDIELDWDYAYLLVNGAPVATNLSTDSNPNGQNFGHGITGSSGGNWLNLTADLSAFAGQTVEISLYYWTDGAVAEPGFMVDNIEISGQPLDGAEVNPGWVFDGFWITTGVEADYYSHYYVAEYRQYRDYDTGLQTGPYNFGFLNTKPDWVEHFPYQDGLLISYRDTFYGDNNTSVHPGGGMVLPIDSHPTALIRPDGYAWRSRVQAFDSPFTLAPTDAVTLHVNGVASPIPSQAGVSVFNDNLQYWNPNTPLAGVMNPHTGTQIRIMGTSGDTMQVRVLSSEINLKGKGVDIAPGDDTPSAVDGTDFGSTPINTGTVVRAFTVENRGKSRLYVPEIQVTGAHSSDFIVTVAPDSQVNPGSSTTFKVEFNPSRPGLRKATVVIKNSDTTEFYYSFDVQGMATSTGFVNHVDNPGFDGYAPLSTVPAFWNAVNFSKFDGKDTTVMKQGAASVKIIAAGWKAMSQTVAVSGEQGDFLSLSFWVKGQSVPVSGSCVVQLKLYDGGAQVFSKLVACPTGTYDFKQMKLAFNAPADYTHATIRIFVQKANGVLWFDFMTLHK